MEEIVAFGIVGLIFLSWIVNRTNAGHPKKEHTESPQYFRHENGNVVHYCGAVETPSGTVFVCEGRNIGKPGNARTMQLTDMNGYQPITAELFHALMSVQPLKAADVNPETERKLQELMRENAALRSQQGGNNGNGMTRPPQHPQPPQRSENGFYPSA